MSADAGHFGAESSYRIYRDELTWRARSRHRTVVYLRLS